MAKPEHLKLAGIVTVVCGGMSSLGVGGDGQRLADGRIRADHTDARVRRKALHDGHERTRRRRIWQP